MDKDRTRTLVVTLDPGLIQQIRNSLEERGGAVSACPTAEGARDEVAQRSYGLVVVSAELPDSNGFELTTMLKAIDPGITVMVTGDDRDGRALEKSIDAGAAGFLLRPVATAELLQRFEDVMGLTWFEVESAASSSSIDAHGDSLDPHAASLVDPRASMFMAGSEYDISVIDHDGVSVVGEVLDADLLRHGRSDEANAADRTQELPPINIQAFDENNPVSIEVGADITAHGLRPVRSTGLEQASSSAGLADEDQDADDDLDQRIDAMLGPDGRITKAVEGAVERAVANALAEQLPAILARLAGATK
jgi:DNA-binding NarL/FixJ family response regulator